MTIIHSAELPIELTNGNDGRGSKWFSSAKRRKQIESILIATGHRRLVPFDVPVSLRITRVMAKRQSAWDADSWQRGNLKEIIDALVSVQWFTDDSPRYITEIRFRQLADNPRPAKSTTIIEVIHDGQNN